MDKRQLIEQFQAGTINRQSKGVLLAQKGAIQNVLDRGFRFEQISVGFNL
jgi:hypothetical protein